MKNLTTRSQLATSLRKLGYRKSELQMARNATMYTKGGGPGGRLWITVARHGGFMIMDRVKRPFDWGFSSVFLGVGNLRAGAAERFGQVLQRLELMNVPHPVEMTPFDLVFAIARGAELDAN